MWMLTPCAKLDKRTFVCVAIVFLCSLDRYFVKETDARHITLGDNERVYGDSVVVEAVLDDHDDESEDNIHIIRDEQSHFRPQSSPLHSPFRKKLVRKNEYEDDENQHNQNQYYYYSTHTNGNNNNHRGSSVVGDESRLTLASEASSAFLNQRNHPNKKVYKKKNPGSPSFRDHSFGDDTLVDDEDPHSYHERYISPSGNKYPASSSTNTNGNEKGKNNEDSETVVANEDDYYNEGSDELGRYSLVNSYFDNEYSLAMLNSMECVTPTKSKGYCSTFRSCVPSLFTPDGQLEAPALAELISFSIGFCTMNVDAESSSNVLMKRSGHRFAQVANRIICCPGTTPPPGSAPSDASVEKFNDFLAGKGPQVSAFDEDDNKTIPSPIGSSLSSQSNQIGQNANIPNAGLPLDVSETEENITPAQPEVPPAQDEPSVIGEGQVTSEGKPESSEESSPVSQEAPEASEEVPTLSNEDKNTQGNVQTIPIEAFISPDKINLYDPHSNKFSDQVFTNLDSTKNKDSPMGGGGGNQDAVQNVQVQGADQDIEHTDPLYENKNSSEEIYGVDSNLGQGQSHDSHSGLGQGQNGRPSGQGQSHNSPSGFGQGQNDRLSGQGQSHNSPSGFGQGQNDGVPYGQGENDATSSSQEQVGGISSGQKQNDGAPSSQGQLGGISSGQGQNDGTTSDQGQQNDGIISGQVQNQQSASNFGQEQNTEGLEFGQINSSGQEQSDDSSSGQGLNDDPNSEFVTGGTPVLNENTGQSGVSGSAISQENESSSLTSNQYLAISNSGDGKVPPIQHGANSTIIQISPKPVKGVNGKFTLEKGVHVEKATSETPRPKPNPAHQTQIGETTVNIIKTEAPIDSNQVVVINSDKTVQGIKDSSTMITDIGMSEESNENTVHKLPPFSVRVPSLSAIGEGASYEEIVAETETSNFQSSYADSTSYPTTTLKYEVGHDIQHNDYLETTTSLPAPEELPTTTNRYSSDNPASTFGIGDQSDEMPPYLNDQYGSNYGNLAGDQSESLQTTTDSYSSGGDSNIAQSFVNDQQSPTTTGKYSDEETSGSYNVNDDNNPTTTGQAVTDGDALFHDGSTGQDVTTTGKYPNQGITDNLGDDKVYSTVYPSLSGGNLLDDSDNTDAGTTTGFSSGVTGDSISQFNGPTTTGSTGGLGDGQSILSDTNQQEDAYTTTLPNTAGVDGQDDEGLPQTTTSEGQNDFPEANPTSGSPTTLNPYFNDGNNPTGDNEQPATTLSTDSSTQGAVKPIETDKFQQVSSDEAFTGSSNELNQNEPIKNQLFLGKPSSVSGSSSYEIQPVDDSAELLHLHGGQKLKPGIKPLGAGSMGGKPSSFPGHTGHVPPEVHQDDSLENEHNSPYPASPTSWSISQLYPEQDKLNPLTSQTSENEGVTSDNQLSAGGVGGTTNDESMPEGSINDEPLDGLSHDGVQNQNYPNTQQENVDNSEASGSSESQEGNTSGQKLGEENNLPAISHDSNPHKNYVKPLLPVFIPGHFSVSQGETEAVVQQSSPNPTEVPSIPETLQPEVVSTTILTPSQVNSGSSLESQSPPQLPPTSSYQKIPLAPMITSKPPTKPVVPASEIGGINPEEITAVQPEYQILSACATQDYYRSLEQDSSKQYPFLATIVGGSRPFCSGTLITDRHILTAAHFLSNITVSDVFHMRVHVGYKTGFGGQTEGPFAVRKVLKVIRHKNFSFDKLVNDIAILILDRPVRFSEDVHPVCLSNSPQLYSDGTSEAFETGWVEDPLMKKISPHHPFIDPHILKYFTFGYENVTWTLQDAVTRVRTNEECQANYAFLEKSGITITDSMVCAQPTDNGKSCSFKGNSGAPLFLSNDGKPIQIGLVSWGIGCGHFPAVFTSVSSYLPWIEKVVSRTS